MSLRGYHTANQIIDEALVGIRDFDRINYKEAAVHFLAGYRDFKLFEAGAQIKDAYRDVTTINTVNFPEDLLRLVDVAVTVNGEYFSFTKSENLVLPITDPLDSTLDTDRGEDDTIDRSPSYGYGTKGSNVEYYYREDRTNRRIVLSRMALDLAKYHNRSEVIVRYVSTGMDDFNTTYIADDAANLLSSYVLYKLVSARPDVYNMNYMMLKKEDYLENLAMYRSLEMPSLTDLEDMIMETSGQNVKR